ncbi:MAG: hypothetical protein ACRCV0_04510 [Brevinema sp.]
MGKLATKVMGDLYVKSSVDTSSKNHLRKGIYQISNNAKQIIK